MSNDEPIHILVVGTGAVGAFYGSRLHQPDQGVFVSFTCRSNYEEVKNNGIELITRSFGNYRMIPHQVFKSIDQAAEYFSIDSNQHNNNNISNNSKSENQNQNFKKTKQNWDFILLCTKVLPDLVDDSELISPLITNQSNDVPLPTLVLIQNGVGFEEQHRIKFPNLPILTAVTVINAQQIKPGVIRQNHWTRICIGPYLNFSYGPNPSSSSQPHLIKSSQDRLELLIKLFKNGQILDAELYSETELQLIRWHKLAINASMNPSSVLSGGLTNAEMIKDPELKKHIKGCMEEIFEAIKKIFKIEEFPTHLATIDQILDSTQKAATQSIIRPSMLTDWLNNRPLELEVILANPIRIANSLGIQLNRLQSMYAFLIQLQLNRSKSLDSNRSKI